jgi:hypothetical protein
MCLERHPCNWLIFLTSSGTSAAEQLARNQVTLSIRRSHMRTLIAALVLSLAAPAAFADTAAPKKDDTAKKDDAKAGDKTAPKAGDKTAPKAGDKTAPKAGDKAGDKGAGTGSAAPKAGDKK